MILERVEKDGLVKALYESSNIVASTYDKNNKDLNIIFKYGGSYTYQGVPDTDYLRFETAESQGVVLNKTLKKYPHLKHDNVDVEKLIEEVNNLNVAEVNAMLVGVNNAMVSFQESYNSTDDKDESLISAKLSKVSEMIKLYNELNNK